MSVQGRVDRWFKAHPAAAALVGVVLLGAIVVMDGARLWQAYDRGESDAGVSIAAGVLASLGVSVFVWRAVRARRANPRRRRFPWTGVVLAVTLIAFILTHPRRGDQPVLTTPLALAVVSYISGLATVGVAVVVVGFRRRPGVARHQRPHASDDQNEVWHITIEDPYFVSRCDCGWVGDAHSATDPNALSLAFDEARRHNPTASPDPVNPLG